MDFTNKIVLITGGTSGIGKAVAKEFAKIGAIVIALTVDQKEKAEAAIKEIGHKAKYIYCDVSNEKQVCDAINTVVKKYGKIDCAFNNAGIGPDGIRMPYQSLTEVVEKTWDVVVDINMKGVFLCLKYELKQMQKQGFGSIVNTSSIGGYKMATGFGAYGPSKAAVLALTELAALENAQYGIRVNVICPGPTKEIELTKNTLASNPKQEQMLTEHVIPMKKLASVKEVSNAVLWLCSDLSSHTTGQKIFIDGGMHIA
ncbi:MAG: SDR family NAD(P)-dependent oxidoreductase [Thomasclavelia sp.]